MKSSTRWRAIDLEVGTLAVRELVFEGTFQWPKTQRFRRTILLGPHTVTSLKGAIGRRSKRSSGSCSQTVPKSQEPDASSDSLVSRRELVEIGGAARI